MDKLYSISTRQGIDIGFLSKHKLDSHKVRKMDCCQAAGIEELMDTQMAERDLKRYRKKGADKTTKLLLAALKDEGVQGLTLLDIGGGVGALQHELLNAGVQDATSVDASSAYLNAAKNEAKSQGHLDRISQHHGDFVEMAGNISEADIVTLDRVICCYDDMRKLVRLSTERAKKLYGVVYPLDNLLNKAITWLENQYRRITKSQFRVFAHPTEAVEALIHDSGLERVFNQETFFWQVHLYRRL